MKNWKFDLFNFKQSLTLDQLEISSIVEGHIQQFDKFSEKEITESLKETLKAYAYDNDVKRLFESMDNELEAAPLIYNLKNLYKKVERKNYGMLYREPLSKILEAINKDTDDERISSVINDLVLYDWVPEIKQFVVEMMSDPNDVRNMTSNGASSTKVFTVVEEVDNGHIAFVGNRWFFLGEDIVKEAVLSDYIEDNKKLKLLQELERAMYIADVENDKLKFSVDENLSISIGMNGKVYLNNEEKDKATTLEDLFNSPIIPMMKKNFYSMVKNVSENLDKIIELDVVNKITSLSKPLCELFVFNFKDKLNLYSIDKRTGSSFFEYESVNQMVEDIQREMGYDISDFVENKLSKEIKQYRKLEDKEKSIQKEVQEVQESIDALSSEGDLLTESVELKTAFDKLLIYKEQLNENLKRIKNAKIAERKRLG